MRALILCFLLGCAPSLPSRTLRQYVQTLEATKSAYYTTCIQMRFRSAEQEADCIVADAHLNAAIDLYMQIGK